MRANARTWHEWNDQSTRGEGCVVLIESLLMNGGLFLCFRWAGWLNDRQCDPDFTNSCFSDVSVDKRLVPLLKRPRNTICALRSVHTFAGVKVFLKKRNLISWGIYSCIYPPTPDSDCMKLFRIHLYANFVNRINSTKCNVNRLYANRNLN